MEFLFILFIIAVIALPGLALITGGLALLVNAIERMSKK